MHTDSTYYFWNSSRALITGTLYYFFQGCRQVCKSGGGIVKCVDANILLVFPLTNLPVRCSSCMHAVSSTHYLELYIAIRALITRHCLHYVTIETIEGMAAKTFGTLFRSKDQQEGSLWRGKGNEGVDGL